MKDVMISITKLNPESQIELAKTHYNLDEVYEWATILKSNYFDLAISKRNYLNEQLIDYLLERGYYYNLAKRSLNLKQERILAESNRMEVIITLSENKNASKTILDYLAKKYPYSHTRIAKNPSAETCTLDWIFEQNEQDKNILCALADNCKTSETVLDKLVKLKTEDLKLLNTLQEKVSANTTTSEVTLQFLSWSKNPTVFRNVLNHPKTNPYTIIRIVNRFFHNRTMAEVTYPISNEEIYLIVAQRAKEYCDKNNLK